MRFGSVCSGIEAASVAWHPMGWQAAFVSEIEKFPCAVLAHHYPCVPNHGDLTKFKEWPDATLDLLVGGTPCQSFSVAGLRKGLDDPRGNLTLTYLAVAARYRPRWLVWENVPGVLSDRTGAFGAFLGGLGELGYGFAYRVLDAQHFGVPQLRRRVFVVGCLGDWRAAAAVLFERASLQGHPAPRRETREGFARGTAPSLTGSGRGVERTGESRGQDPVIPVTVGTLSDGAHNGGGSTGRTPIAGELSRCLNAGGQGRQDWETETLIPTTGGGFDEARNYADAAISHALRGEGFDAMEDGTGRGTPIVPVAFTQNQRDEVRNLEDVAGSRAGEPGMKQQTYIAFSAKDHGGDAGETAPTLRAGGHTNSHANAGVMPAVAFCNTAGDTALGLSKPGVPPLTSRHGDPGNVLLGMQVRRLTPRECERLQGFPDDYTLIPFRGKPAADGPRYKALGNSMAVPVMRWIGERIQRFEHLRGIHEWESAA